MLKKILITALIPAISLFKAQETIPVYQQYSMDGQALFNPAYYGSTDKVELNLNYQKQYANLAQSPSTQTLNLNANIVDRVGAGLTVFRDQQGALSSYGVGLGASYFVPLSDEDNRNDQYSFGMSTNLFNESIDYSLINAQNKNDNLFGNNSYFICYMNLGMRASYSGLHLGAAVADIMVSNTVPVVNGVEPSPTKYLINGGYDWKLDDSFVLEPTFLINLNTNSSKMYDLNLMAKLIDGENSFSAGVNYRTSLDKFANQRLELSPMLKMKFDQLTVGAVYTFGLSGIQNVSGSSFMIGLGYSFDNFINTRGYRYK
jgi:type IX secretion system PorP/SprF family membrane protein